MSKYPTTNIVYSGVEDKGGPTVTILDEKKNKWTIWKADYENKDQNSEAYGSLQSYRVGESFGVEYGEKEESFVKKDGPDAGKTIKFTRRTIYKILPLVSNPTALAPNSPARQESSNGGANRGPSGESRDAFGRRLALHGMVNARLVNHDIVKVLSELGELLRLEDLIEEKLSEAIRPTNLNQDDLPVIQQDEDLGADIPF